MSSSDKQFSVEEEYKKNNGITDADTAQLRKWVMTQPHLPGQHITDLDLILAYHCCDRSFGVAKQVLDLNITLRTLFTAYFKDRYVDNVVERTLKTFCFTPLPTRTKEGYAILYTHFLDCDPKSFVLPEAIRVIFMVLDLWQYEQGTWPGFLLTIDYQGLSLGHLAKVDLINLQHLLYYLQEAILVKLKGLHFINAPSFIDKLLLMMKPFMKKEMLDMLYIHTVGSDSLAKFVPLEALPKDSGGNYKTCVECRDDVLAKLKANKDYFVEENKKRVTESLRPGKPKTISDIFSGVEGSFKKLDID